MAPFDPMSRKPPYSIRDVPRLHARSFALAHPELHPPGARLVVDAVEDEFKRQSTKQEKEPKKASKENKEEETNKKQAGAPAADQRTPPGGGLDKDGQAIDGQPSQPPSPSQTRQIDHDKHKQQTSKTYKDSLEQSGGKETAVLAEARRIASLHLQLAALPAPPDYPLTDIDDADAGTADNWVPRLTSALPHTLTRLTGFLPFNAEPTLPSLYNDGLITSTFHHYVRNHGPVPFLEWETHKVRVCGLGVDKEASMDEIVNMEKVEMAVTMACDGMRRAEVNREKRSKGFDWSAGAAATAIWRGTPLHSFLLAHFPSLKPSSNLHVRFEGADDLPNGRYGTSLPLDYVLDPANACLLAFGMNGRVLAPDHGYPLRTILPGMVGGRTVKWLHKIEIAETESQSYYHFRDNRFYPAEVKTEDDVEQGWDRHPDTIITHLPLQSVIVYPAPGERIPVTQSGTYTIRGFAFTGAGARVTRTEVLFSIPGKPTEWRYATREFLPTPGPSYKHFTWCFWSLDVPVLDLIACTEISVRAQDEKHASQPDRSVWNFGGFMGNGIYRVQRRLEQEEHEPACAVFLHPTDTSNPENGWMEKSEEEKVEEARSRAGTETLEEIGWEEIKKHVNKESLWIVMDGVLYDVTQFVAHHPGGLRPILSHAGTDVTTVFNSIHDARARTMASAYAIGRVSDPEPTERKKRPGLAHIADSPTAIHPSRWTMASLVNKEDVSHDTRKFTFKVPEGKGKLGLPVGKHIRVGVHFRDRMVQRPYTPVRPIFENEDDGTFDLVVKIYFPQTDPRYPPGGVVSNFLDTMEIGDKVDVKGPEGFIEYDGHGKFNVAAEDLEVKRVSLVAGGTGITPIYQLIHRILMDPSDRTELRLVFANKTVDDILLRSELDTLASKCADRFQLLYSVDNEPGSEDERKGIGHFGRIDGKTLEFLFPPEKTVNGQGRPRKETTIALLCGPPPMIEKEVFPAFEKMGFSKDHNVWSF